MIFIQVNQYKISIVLKTMNAITLKGSATNATMM